MQDPSASVDTGCLPWRDGEPWEGHSAPPHSSGWGRRGARQLWHSWDEPLGSVAPRIPPGIDTKHSLQKQEDKDTKPGGDVTFPTWDTKPGGTSPSPRGDGSHAPVTANISRQGAHPPRRQLKPTRPLSSVPKPSKTKAPRGVWQKIAQCRPWPFPWRNLNARVGWSS